MLRDFSPLDERFFQKRGNFHLWFDVFEDVGEDQEGKSLDLLEIVLEKVGHSIH